MSRVGMVFVVGCLTWLALADTAAAYLVEPVVQQHISTVAEQQARGGATQVPGVQCSTACDELWARERQAVSGPGSGQLQGELRSLRSAQRLIPALSAVGTALLAVETFRLDGG